MKYEKNESRNFNNWNKKGNKYGECNVFLLFVDGKLDYSIVIESCEEDLDILTKKVINEYGIKNFDIICWTHPHDDHSYGMLKLLQEYSNKHTKIVIPSELGRIAKCMTKDCKKIYDYTDALLNKFNTATCENMTCVTTAFQIGNVMLPNKGILDEYAKLGNVYCTSGLYSRNKTYGIVKSIFKFGYDREKLNIEDIECKTEGDACKYETVF